MNTWNENLSKAISELETSVSQIMAAEKVFFGQANPPQSSGAYIIYDHNGELSYIGVAKGSGGLRDRLLNKHISGDDKHAIQRAYKESYPDRQRRREYIRKNVRVHWVATKDANTALAVESLLILMFNPPWNRG